MLSFQNQRAQMSMAMQQVGQSLEELARGQAQMLNMMQPNLTPAPKPAATPTPSLHESFHLDAPEAVAWSDVELEGSSPGSMFNPNEMMPNYDNNNHDPGRHGW